MMIFNSFTVANDYSFGAQWPIGRGRRFFLQANKTCGEISSKGVVNYFFYLKSFCKKKIIKFSFKLIHEQVN